MTQIMLLLNQQAFDAHEARKADHVRALRRSRPSRKARRALAGRRRLPKRARASLGGSPPGAGGRLLQL